jgi:hypothetical protein
MYRKANHIDTPHIISMWLSLMLPTVSFPFLLCLSTSIIILMYLTVINHTSFVSQLSIGVTKYPRKSTCMDIFVLNYNLRDFSQCLAGFCCFCPHRKAEYHEKRACGGTNLFTSWWPPSKMRTRKGLGSQYPLQSQPPRT